MFIHVLYPSGCLFRRASAEIQGDLRLCANQFAVLQEFIGSELVVLRDAPRDIEHGHALVQWTNAVGPVIGRSEVAPEAHQWSLHGTGHRDHVGIHAVHCVCREQRRPDPPARGFRRVRRARNQLVPAVRVLLQGYPARPDTSANHQRSMRRFVKRGRYRVCSARGSKSPAIRGR